MTSDHCPSAAIFSQSSQQSLLFWSRFSLPSLCAMPLYPAPPCCFLPLILPFIPGCFICLLFSLFSSPTSLLASPGTRWALSDSLVMASPLKLLHFFVFAVDGDLGRMSADARATGPAMWVTALCLVQSQIIRMLFYSHRGNLKGSE